MVDCLNNNKKINLKILNSKKRKGKKNKIKIKT